MIQDQSEEIQRLQTALREIIAMVELPDVSKKTISNYRRPPYMPRPGRPVRSRKLGT